MSRSGMTFQAWLKAKGELWSTDCIDAMRRQWAFLLNKGLTPDEIVPVFDTIWGSAEAQYGG